MPLALFALTLSAFAIGTTEFVIVGLIPTIAEQLNVSLPSAGLLVSLYALGVAIGAPVHTALTGQLPRKWLLVGLAYFLPYTYLQGLNNEFLQAKGEARFMRVVEMPASRGAVTSPGPLDFTCASSCENFFWKRETRPPRSRICCWPPVQAGCDLESMSSCIVSPSLPQVLRVLNLVPSVMTTLISW